MWDSRYSQRCYWGLQFPGSNRALEIPDSFLSGFFSNLEEKRSYWFLQSTEQVLCGLCRLRVLYRRVTLVHHDLLNYEKTWILDLVQYLEFTALSGFDVRRETCALFKRDPINRLPVGVERLCSPAALGGCYPLVAWYGGSILGRERSWCVCAYFRRLGKRRGDGIAGNEEWYIGSVHCRWQNKEFSNFALLIELIIILTVDKHCERHSKSVCIGRSFVSFTWQYEL